MWFAQQKPSLSQRQHYTCSRNFSHTNDKTYISPTVGFLNFWSSQASGKRRRSNYDRISEMWTYTFSPRVSRPRSMSNCSVGDTSLAVKGDGARSLLYCIALLLCNAVKKLHRNFRSQQFHLLLLVADGLLGMILKGMEVSTLTVCYTKMRFICILYEYRTRVHSSSILSSKFTPVEAAEGETCMSVNYSVIAINSFRTRTVFCYLISCLSSFIFCFHMLSTAISAPISTFKCTYLLISFPHQYL